MSLRIGLVVHGQPPELVGGTEGLVARLGAALAERGHEVEIFSGSIEWRPAFEVVRDASGPVPVVRVHRSDLFFERWDKLRNPFVERAYLEWLGRFRPDVVHVHHWARLSTRLVAAARARGLPAALTLHDLLASCPRYHRVKEDLSFCAVAPSPEACRHCAPRWPHQGDAEIDASLEAFVAELRDEVVQADVLLAPSAGHAARVLGMLGLGGRRKAVTVLPPASEAALAPATRPLGERVASAAEPLRAGVFGHLHPLKGVEVLLDAQALLEDPATLEIHVWGAAPTPEMGAVIRARAGDRRVVWHGAYRPEDLGGAPIDVAVLPTLCAESYSFALDEAAALGVPVVATDLGALADRATVRMRHFPRGDAAALARELARLAADPAAREAMARAPAPPRIGLAAHLDVLLPIYEDLVRRGAERSGPSDRGARGERLPAAGAASGAAADRGGSAGLTAGLTAGEEAALAAAEAGFLLREEALRRGLGGG